MIYRKLFDWIDSDDACEATSVTLYSAHDPGHDEEKDFIIRRVKRLIETGVAIQSVKLTTVSDQAIGIVARDFQVPDYCLNDVDLISGVIEKVYEEGEAIETMIITVNIKEHHWA